MALFVMADRPLARAKKTEADVIVAQTREIADLMARGRWIRGITELQKCEEWGITVTAIRDRSAEARRLVQHAYGDLSDLRDRFLAQLDTIAGETARTEPRVAVQAIMGAAQIAGVIVTRHQDGRNALPRGSAGTPEERRAEIARIRQQLDEADALAIAEMGGDPGVVDARDTSEVDNEGNG